MALITSQSSQQASLLFPVLSDASGIDKDDLSDAQGIQHGMKGVRGERGFTRGGREGGVGAAGRRARVGRNLLMLSNGSH